MAEMDRNVSTCISLFWLHRSSQTKQTLIFSCILFLARRDVQYLDLHVWTGKTSARLESLHTNGDQSNDLPCHRKPQRHERWAACPRHVNRFTAMWLTSNSSLMQMSITINLLSLSTAHGPNCTCEEMMNQGSYVKELLQLYKYNELHRKVLELLNQLAMDTNSVTYSELSTYQVGPEDIMDYLKVTSIFSYIATCAT